MSFSKNLVTSLVAEELRAANASHRQFHSLHEGYAVLREEVDECQDEYDKMILNVNDLWQAVKHDDNVVAAEKLGMIEATAIQLAAEAIQAAAMARKAKKVAMAEKHT